MASSNRDPRWLWLPAAGLILIFLVQAFAESRIKSVTSDEPPHIAAGLSYIQARAFRANLQHPPLIKELAALALLLAGVRLPRGAETGRMLYGQFTPRSSPEWTVGNQVITGNGIDRVLAWARAPMLLVAGFLAAVLFLWGRQLFGGWPALGAVFLCTMDPTILSHSYLVTTDVGVTCFTLLFLFALWQYARAPGRRGLVWCGLALGAVLSVKFSAVLLLPVAGMLLVASRIWPIETPERSPAAPGVGRDKPRPRGSGKKHKARRDPAVAAKPARRPGSRLLQHAVSSAGPFLAMCAIAAIVIEAVYLFRNGPSLYLTGLHEVNADHNPDYPFFLAGEYGFRFLSYFAVTWLLKEPIATIVLAIVGLAALIRSRTIPTATKLFLLAPPAVFFLGATFMAADVGIRYIMPVLPFGYLLGGLGLASLVRRPAKWAMAAAAVLCAWVVVAAFGVYPDRLSYFNESACLLREPGEIALDGGTRCGPLWLDDSNVDWGQSMKQLRAWLDLHAAGRPLRLFPFYMFPPEAYGIRSTPVDVVELAAPPRAGLYAVSATLVARVPSYPGANDWLRRLRPAAIVGHAVYIYDIAGPGGMSPAQRGAP